MSMMR
jgi:casein kinase II subunit beta